VLETFFGVVWRTLRGLGVPRAGADDAAQHVFTVLAEKLGDIEPGKERAFLLATALRVAANERRALARRPEDATDCCDDHGHSHPGPEELTAARQARRVLDEVLAAMPLEQRAVFVMFELEELTLSEVALTLNLPRGTVASRLRAARVVFAREAKRRRAAAKLRGESP
jgi:RNA polymerase sigma-70 factor (ECF subfamily)